MIPFEDMETRAKRRWWLASRRLAAVLVIFLIAAPYALVTFADDLNAFALFGVPLGYALATQGAVIILSGFAFWLAAQQDAIDHRFGVSEED